MFDGFIDDHHRRAFLSAAIQQQFGSPGRVQCGARTRNGGTCKAAPLAEHNRCIKHCGPKAARAHREAQLRELAAGRLDPAIFARAEARRAANRLRDLWKRRGPWVPGSTLDLGPHEDAFVAALRARGWAAEALPPAIADKLRWAFRRTMVDRARPDQWNEMLAALPELVKAAGPCPDEFGGAAMAVAVPVVATPARLPPSSRRRLADTAKTSRARKVGCASLLPLPILSHDDAAKVLRAHRADLAAILAKCETEEQRLNVAAGFTVLRDHPDAIAAHHTWAALLREIETDG